MFFDRKKLRKAVAEVTERTEALERDNKRMRLEWEDTFDKLQAVVQRIAKRAQRVEALAKEEEEEQLPDLSATPPHLSLNARRNAINAKILARRAALREKPQ